MEKLTKIEYPLNHKPGMRVPRGGSSCSSCEYLGSDGETCKNKYFIKWNGSNVLPAPADSYCSDWYEPQEKKMEGKKKHKFSHTHVELHEDGSASIHHVHEDGSHKDVKHAVGDLDGVHDSFEEHLNPEKEEELEEKVHPGIHDEIMKMAGKGE